MNNWSKKKIILLITGLIIFLFGTWLVNGILGAPIEPDMIKSKEAVLDWQKKSNLKQEDEK